MNLINELGVSRETIERLEIYAELLRRWNPAINLVAKSTVGRLWERHFRDSAQLLHLVDHPITHWADLGSGGGFPGLVIAILAIERKSPSKVTLVESDLRKSIFLSTVIRETGANVTVLPARIENIAPLEADVLSARALGSLEKLLCFANRHLRPDGTALFPKGISWQKELIKAQTAWCFSHQVVKSNTEIGPVILRIQGVSRV